jgi:hypothetical protein
MCSLPFQIGQPLARQLMSQERLQPVLGDRLEPLVPGQRTQRLGIVGHALALARSRPSAGAPWSRIPGASAQSRAPADRSTSEASRRRRARGRLRTAYQVAFAPEGEAEEEEGNAPRRRASRSKDREEQ